MLSVSDLMTPRGQLATLTPEDRLESARELMASRQIRHIPIVDPADHVVGIVSHRDVLAATGPASDGRDPEASEDIPLARLMSTEVEVVDERVGLRTAGEFMHRHRFGCLPVVRQDILVGIITDSDYLEVALSLLEQAETTEPEEVDTSA
jgi:CBS domain-containing protein